MRLPELQPRSVRRADGAAHGWALPSSFRAHRRGSLDAALGTSTAERTGAPPSRSGVERSSGGRESFGLPARDLRAEGPANARDGGADLRVGAAELRRARPPSKPAGAPAALLGDRQGLAGRSLLGALP